MAHDFDVGATLHLRNVTRFRGDARVAAESVDNIREKADRASRSLTVMGRIGKAAGRGVLRGLKFAAVGAATAIGLIGAFSIKASLESQDAQAQIVAGIKSTGGAANVTAKHIDDLSIRIMKYSGMSDEIVKTGAAMLLTFRGVRNELGKGNDIFDQAIMASADLATRFKTDIPNATKMLGKALDDPIRGVTALRRMGVGFSQEQQDRIKQLVETNQLLAAQKLILREVNKQVGGSAAAAGRTDRGKINIAKETIQNSLENVGAALLPVVTGVLPMLAKTLSGLFTDLTPVLTEVARSIAKVLPGLIHSLLPAMKTLGSLFADLIKMAGPLLRVLGKTFGSLVAKLMPALKPFLEALARALLPIVKAFAPLLGVFADNLAFVLKLLTPLLEPLGKLLGFFLRITAVVQGGLSRAIRWLIEHLLKPLAAAFWAVVHAIQKVIEFFARLPGFATSATIDPNSKLDPNSPLGRILSPGGPAPRPRARGGPMLAMRPYIVGEDGPELVVSPRDRWVIPNTAVQRGDDGGELSPMHRNYLSKGAIQIVVNGADDPDTVGRKVAKHVSDRLARL